LLYCVCKEIKVLILPYLKEELERMDYLQLGQVTPFSARKDIYQYPISESSSPLGHRMDVSRCTSTNFDRFGNMVALEAIPLSQRLRHIAAI